MKKSRMRTRIRIDCIWEERDEIAWVIRDGIGAIVRDSLFQKTPIIIPKEPAVQPGDAYEDTAFKPGLEIVKILKHVVESHLFIYLRNR